MRLRYTRILTVGVLATLALLPERAQVVSAITGAPLAGIRLGLSWRYLALTPLTSTLDYLTLLTPRGHVLTLCLIFAAYALWRILRMRAARPGRRWPVRAALELGKLALFVVGLALFYVYGALGPRPMARLISDDPDLVTIDFHSHTESSHDGRPGFTVEREMAWHRAAGFDVFYITDHDSTRAAIDAAAGNPGVSGSGLIVFPGREVVFRDEHVLVLGTSDPRGDQGVGPSAESCWGMPLLIQTIPENLSRVPGAMCRDGTGGVQAIELVDGDPRGLDQGSRDRERILAIADSLGLAVVAASNLHGWGRTAPGWSVMKIPGWRGMTPDGLSGRIEDEIRARGVTAVTPVVRREAYATSPAFGPAAAVLLPLDALTLLSRGQRIAWMLWGGLALAFFRNRKSRLAVAG